MFEIVTAVVAAAVAPAAFALSVYNFFHARSVTRKKLVNTAHLHAKLAVYNLKRMDESIETARAKIRGDESYTPHIPRSPHADLTYDHIIELREWLGGDEHEKIVFGYFHAQSALHALAKSFDLAIASGNFSPPQKLELLAAYEKSCSQTLQYAREVARILAEAKSQNFMRRIFRRLQISASKAVY